MAGRQVPEWAAKRTRGNRVIAIVLFGLVAFYVTLFVVTNIFK